MAELLSNAPNGHELVSTLDLTERRNARKIHTFSAFIGFLVVMICIIALSVSGYSPYLVAITIPLLIPMVLLHELSHYVFQWLFSHQRPRLGFKFPFTYSALAVGARISRNQGIFCAFAPLVFVTMLLGLPSLLVSFVPKVILLALVSFNIATCVGDFLVINWLLRHPKHTQLGIIGLSNALFRDMPNSWLCRITKYAQRFGTTPAPVHQAKGKVLRIRGNNSRNCNLRGLALSSALCN